MWTMYIVQGVAERTPWFGRDIASGGECVQWWGARRTAVCVLFSVYTMAWSGEYQAFIVEEFIRYGGSPVATQRAFRIRFALGRRETVPDKQTIYRWVSNFRQTGSALKQTSPGRSRTATWPENVAVVRASIQKSPRRCTETCGCTKFVWQKCEENFAPRSANASLQNSDCTKTDGNWFRKPYKVVSWPSERSRHRRCVFFFLMTHISTSLAQ